MREVQASEAKTHLPRLLNGVERGEVIVITRHGRPIARLVPEARCRESEIRAAIDGIKALRRVEALLPAAEIATPSRTDREV